MKTSTKGRGGVRSGRGAGSLLDVESMTAGEPVRGPGGCRVVKTNDGDVCPADWADAFMVYPPGSLVVPSHPLDFMCEEQWELATRMLSEGFVLGINASEAEVPDAVCAVASRCSFNLTAVREPQGNDVVFVARRGAVHTALVGKKK